MKRVVASLCFVALAGCQEEAPAPFVLEQPIINGQLATAGQFPNIPSLTFAFEDDTLTHYCTGSLIAPDVVLTAAHCVDPTVYAFQGLPLSQEDITDLTRVVFGQLDVNEPLVEGARSIRARATFPHPEFNVFQVQTEGKDVGIVLLEEPITDIEPLPLFTGDFDSLLGIDFVAVGYGVDNAAAQSGAGVQRFTNLTVDFLQKAEIYGYGDGTTNVCFGDSGGPDLATIDGVVTQIGIHSFVSNQQCSDLGFSQRVDTQSGFIGSVGVGCSEDGLCDPSCAQFGPADPDCDGVNAGADDGDLAFTGGCSTSPANPSPFGLFGILLAVFFSSWRRAGRSRRFF